MVHAPWLLQVRNDAVRRWDKHDAGRIALPVAIAAPRSLGVRLLRHAAAPSPARMDACVGWAITPAPIRRYAGRSALALPPGLATKRAPTRFGSWMKAMQADAIYAGQ